MLLHYLIMELSNEIILRPRFKFKVNEINNVLLSLFEDKGKTQSDFIVTRVVVQVFNKIPKAKATLLITATQFGN